MKKQTKSDAVKAAKPTTPASPAPSPVKKVKSASKSKASKPPAQAVSTAVVEEAIAPAVTPVVKKDEVVTPLTTTVVAQIDVGFGNTLYIRGEGPGLSWEKGLALDCVADDKWSTTIAETTKPVVFKFLINDQTWCTGDDYVAQPGTTLTVTPVF